MSNDLEILKLHRNALLLAEAAAWLHDMGKCTDEHLINQANDRPPGYKYQYKTAYSSLLATAPLFNLLGESVALKTLVEQARPAVVSDASHPWLLRVLGRCHAAAHIEKEEADRTGKQPASDTRMSTAYGFEQLPLNGLTANLKGLPYANLTERTIFNLAVRQAFSKALGETRRPENEITLWDWSGLVAALYKAALAGALLGYRPSDPADLRWRLLSIRFDGLSFFAQSHHLPDLLARRKLLNEALDQVRDLLEVEYPLGTEVYRDEDGSIFVVPGCNSLGLLALQDRGKTLRDRILDQVRSRLEGEAVPTIRIDGKPWWGQDPQRQGNDEIPPVPDHLEPVVSAADPAWVEQQWSRQQEICPVCGLRPQGPSPKAQSRKVCDICEQRRADRAKEWATSKLDTTIWTDEVADENGRLALVVGQFDLERWLDGMLVQTLTVTDPAQDSSPNKANVARKNPSFARIRRVWETTRTFWQTALDERGPDGGPLLPQPAPRLEIIPQNRRRLDLGPFHTYELALNGVRLSVVWDSDNKRFITCDNLDYLTKPEQLGRSVEQALNEAKEQRRPITVEEPVGYGGRNKIWGTMVVEKVRPLPDTYTPAIPILAEPRTFMALVPAHKALAVAQAIKGKYETEMGKVRNRLPLTLDVVYAGRRTPLAAILDAGRRMLRYPVQTVRAEVKELTPQNPLEDGWPSALDVKLRIGEREIVVRVPTVMGDGKTPDVWYPYWQVAGKPTDRKRWFVGPDGEHWVHVCDLRPGEIVAFTPSIFDFEYLDAGGRRFEVAYGGDGQRLGVGKRQRPYLLEEMDAFEQVWREIRRLTRSQIHTVEALIEGKRRAWEQPTGTLSVSPTFRQFVGDVLREAQVYTPALEQAALIGLLADVLEIHLTIHKEKPQPEEA